MTREEMEPPMVPGSSPHQKHSRTRRYQALAEKLRQHLAAGTWAPGQKIPTLRELASQFEVSTNTVRNAIRVLEREDSVYHVPAVGTFVRPIQLTHVATDQVAVAVVATDIGAPFAIDVVRGVEQACQERRWRLQIYNSRLDNHLEVDNLSRLGNSGARGAVLFPGCAEATIETIFQLKFSGFPLVLVDRSIYGLQVDTVQSDHEKGAFGAVEHLIQAGHRRIFMHAGSQPPPSSVKSRIRGYERALQTVGVRPLPDWFIWSEPVSPQDVAEGRSGRWFRARDAALQVLKSTELPTAIFAENAYTAVGTLRACQELGLRVPEDISIICFDDSEITRVTLPPISYVAQRPAELGRKAIELLEQRLQSPAEEPKHVVVPVELVKRLSVAPPGPMASPCPGIVNCPAGQPA